VVYARPGDHMTWITRGYLHEGVIAGFFADGTDAHLWAAYGEEARSEAPRDARHDEIVKEAAALAPVPRPPLPPRCSCHRAEAGDASAIAALLGGVFSDYPTPLTPRALGGRIADGAHL
jgi:hypothetical protein